MGDVYIFLTAFKRVVFCPVCNVNFSRATRECVGNIYVPLNFFPLQEQLEEID